MRHALSKITAILLFSGLALLAPVAHATASGIMVTKAYVRAPATAQVAAAYVSLMAHGGADRLIGVSTPVAKMAGLHRTVDDNGVMKMEHVEAIDVPADGQLMMKPGGYHIMLMGLTAPLKEGDEVELTLTFEKAGAVKVKAKVGGVAAGVD